MDAEEIDDDFFCESGALNETLPVLSEEEDYADTTINQSADSLYRSSGSSLFIPNVRKTKAPKSIQPRKRASSKQVNTAKFHCHICGRSLKTEKGLSKHILNIHKLRGKCLLLCHKRMM